MSFSFGYVEFDSQEAADAAKANLDQQVLEGRRMSVQYTSKNASQRDGGALRPPVAPSKTLFIGNMSFEMSDKDLNDLFRNIKNVLDVRVAIDRRTGQPRGFAHADFIDVASAENAKMELADKVIFGRKLRVDFSASTTGSRRNG